MSMLRVVGCQFQCVATVPPVEEPFSGVSTTGGKAALFVGYAGVQAVR
jgi:hypothetical protein